MMLKEINEWLNDLSKNIQNKRKAIKELYPEKKKKKHKHKKKKKAKKDKDKEKEKEGE